MPVMAATSISAISSGWNGQQLFLQDRQKDADGLSVADPASLLADACLRETARGSTVIIALLDVVESAPLET